MSNKMKKLLGVLSATILCGFLNQAWAQSPVREYGLEFGVTGRVANVYVSEGEQVDQGQLLADLDETWFAAQLEAALAALAASEAELFEVQNALDRNQVLYDEGSLSGVELELSRIRMLKSNSGYLSARAEMIRAKGMLGLSKIIAPASGTISKIATGPGENIVAGSQRTPSIVMQSTGQ